MMMQSYEEAVSEHGLENITSIFATYGSATFRTAIFPADVDNVMEIARKGAEQIKKKDKRADVRAEARGWVIGMIESNRHLKVDTGSAVAGTLLWLACTSPEPAGSHALRRAKEGGATIAYEITGGEDGYAFNFRLIIDGRPGDPWPATPKHPLPGLPGGPSLH